jgi:hypothetical protein
MRQLILGCVLLFSSTYTYLYSQESVAQQQIRAVLDAETEQYKQRPMGEVASEFWVLDTATRLTISFHDGVVVYFNADQILAQQIIAMEDVLGNEIDHLMVSINGNLAYCTFNRVIRVKDSDMVLYSREIRVLEEVGDTWKTHLASVHYYTK